MAIPLLVPAIISMGSYVMGKGWLSDDEKVDTGASVYKVAVVGLALFGAYVVYSKIKEK